MIFVLASCYTASALSAGSEYTVKAAFIEKLTHFIDWPANSPLSSSNHVFSLCVIGKNPFAGHLQQLSKLTKIKRKKVLFLKISSSLEIQRCDLLFIANESSLPINDILKTTKHFPVLSVCDTPGFAEHGCIINFFTLKGRLGFEVNLDRAKASGFNISSRLLKMARIVGKDNNAP